MRTYLIFLLLFFPFLANAEEKAPKDIVIVPREKTIAGNYYAMGDSIEISGTVTGDLYVLASQVFIDGHVQGDVLALAGSVDIAGTVDGNIRALGGQITLSGTTGHNVSVLSGNLQLIAKANIQGNLVAISGNIDLASNVAEDATLVASNARVSSHIVRDLDAHVGQLRLTSRAEIDGDLTYNSNAVTWIDSGAKIGGKISFEPSLMSRVFRGRWIEGLLIGSKIATLLMNFLYSFVVGIILIRFYPDKLKKSLFNLHYFPWKSLAVGLGFLVIFPIVTLLLMMTILGVPFALTFIALNIIAFYTAKVISILFVSNYLFKKMGTHPNTIPTLTLGLILYFALIQIPIFGTILALTAMIFGLGASLVTTQNAKRRTQN